MGTVFQYLPAPAPTPRLSVSVSHSVELSRASELRPRGSQAQRAHKMAAGISPSYTDTCSAAPPSSGVPRPSYREPERRRRRPRPAAAPYLRGPRNAPPRSHPQGLRLAAGGAAWDSAFSPARPLSPGDRACPRPQPLAGSPACQDGLPGAAAGVPSSLPTARPLTPRAAYCPPASCGARAAAGCCPSCRRPPRPLRSPRPPRRPGAGGEGAGSGRAGPAAQGRGRERRATRGAARAARPTDTAAPWAPLRAAPTRAPARRPGPPQCPRPRRAPPTRASPRPRAPRRVRARERERASRRTHPTPGILSCSLRAARTHPALLTPPPRRGHSRAQPASSAATCASRWGPPSFGPGLGGEGGQVFGPPHTLWHQSHPSLQLHS